MAASNPPTPPPTADELRELVAHAVAIEYLEYRKTAAEKKLSSDRKPTWLQLFESVGFAALVTVVLGGFAGGFITFQLQQYAKLRDTQAAAAQLQHDQKLTAFKEHLDRERMVVDEMFLRLGKFVDASRDLTTLSRKEFCDECDRSGTHKRLESEKQEIVKRYNDETIEWNTNRLRLGMLLQLEHDNDVDLLREWQQTSDEAEAYSECADRWRTKYDNLEFHEALKACVADRDELYSTLQTFTQRIVSLRNSSEAGSPRSSPE
jgi:hypothetical protein